MGKLFWESFWTSFLETDFEGAFNSILAEILIELSTDQERKLTENSQKIKASMSEKIRRNEI